MTFNTALSGLSAASSDLRVTGNNIANASTVGFKASRAQFADVYASTLLGSGANQIGSGVKLANVAQQFDQGTISFTNNALDLAIDGSGFFVLSDQGARSYTRAGMFGVDDQGYITSAEGSRVQGFTANAAGTLSGILGDLRIQTSNLAPARTTLVEATLNLDAREPVLSRIGTTIGAEGTAVGVAQPGIATPTSSVLETSGAPVPFDFSIDEASAITGNNVLTPFDFSTNDPSAVTGFGLINGFNFGLNTPSSLTGSTTPLNFDFSSRPSAVTGSTAWADIDFSGGNSASFDVSIAGSSADGTASVTLNSNYADLAAMVTDINGQLGGVGVSARIDPATGNRLQFIASTAGEASVLTVDNFAVSGATSLANLGSALSSISDGQQSVRSSFDVTVSGGTSDGTATITLTDNLVNLPALIADIDDQLSASGIGVSVREDPDNAGRLQFYSSDTGVATTITVDNYRTTDAGVSTTNIANVLRLSDGASNPVPGPGAIGVTGSFTASTFDVTIAGGSGPGGNTTATVTLDENIADGDVDGLVDLINNQLESVPLPGIDVRAEEDPTNPGRIRFAATVAGEASTVTVDNFQVSGVAGDVQASAADVRDVLGGITDGTSDSGGNNTNASFQVSLSGASSPGENQTVTVTLDSNIATLQDLISDIRDDLVTSGIGVDVREDPNAFGRLQFFATSSGEASVITVDPNDNASFGNGVTAANVEAVLGGISLGQAGGSGSSSSVPNPFGGTSASAQVGNLTAASFDLTLSGAGEGNGTVTVSLDSDIQSLNDLIADIRDDVVPSGVGIDVREDPDNPGRLQFFATSAGEASNIIVSNLDASNIGVSQTDLANTLNLATGVSIAGVASVDNGYEAQTLDVVQPDGTVTTITTQAGASAAEIAGQFSSSLVPGVTATASTLATIPAAAYNNASGTLALTVNGVSVSGADVSALADAINNTPGLGTVSATLNAAGDLEVRDQIGNDLVFEVVSGNAADSLSVQGTQGAALTLATGGTAAAAIGGELDFTLDEGVAFENAAPAGSNLFGVLTPAAFESFELNTFDPTNQETYNAATSATIYDSLGNPHVLSMYFVKERAVDGIAGQEPNRWAMHVLVDGRDVGDPDPNLPPPANTEPTRATFAVQFNEDGTLDPTGTDPILISNWTPLDANGEPNGAEGALNQLLGGSLPVADPPTSSNFELRLTGSTQFGTGFALNSIDQNGFTSGELSGLAIDEEGLVSARFTNGQTQSLGQIALADFSNVQGLQAVGNTGWIETSESGEPVIAAPASGSLGTLTSGALEDSNVELSEQLVQLLIAQRNFQANARTISTSDEITQTIINL